MGDRLRSEKCHDRTSGLDESNCPKVAAIDLLWDPDELVSEGIMKTAAWAIVAFPLWWLVATIGCGGVVCVPVVLFFHLPYWLPVIAYSAGAEWISRKYAGRWSPLCLVGLMALGGGYFLYVLKGRFPLLFVDAEHSMLPMAMMIKPTGAIIALYLVKAFYDWRCAEAKRRKSS
jgi:hypothetical protein